MREYDIAHLPAINGDFYEKNIYNNDAGSHRGFSQGERVLREAWYQYHESQL
jgi:hypothetical protein